MTWDEAYSEVINRGYHYLPQSRIESFVWLAFVELCGEESWPFLEAQASGPAPLDIDDLSQVLYVSTENRTLTGKDLRDILDLDPSLGSEGDPQHWYLYKNTVKVWPASTGDIMVHYVQTPPPAVSVQEIPVPQAYQQILIEGGVMRALKDNDEYDTAAGIQQQIDSMTSDMAAALLHRNFQNPDQITQTRPAEDYTC